MYRSVSFIRYLIVGLIFIFNCAAVEAARASQEEIRDVGEHGLGSMTAPLDVRQYLVEFHKNPRRIMTARLVKRDEDGVVVHSTQSLFSVSDIRSGKYRVFRDEVRAQMCQRAGVDCAGKASSEGVDPMVSPGEKDSIEQFLTTMRILREPAEMEQLGLIHHTLQVSPWSDSFWPVQKGLTGRRFADGGYPNSKSWSDNFAYINARPAWTIAPDNMSPAEKYDYLVGDRSWKMTHWVWNKGQRYMNRYGFVPSWTGLCHGWAPAAIMTPLPKQTVTLKAYNGGSVTFLASDIKALASQLWGEAPPIVRFAGARCKKFNPREDEVGRITDPNCYDINPGTFHMALVNQMGVAKRSFVIDSTFDFEVWNYPMYAYQYHYFNPQTLAVSKSISGSVVSRDRFTIDKFKRYRNPKTKSFVGIAMDATYAIPTQPSRKVINRQSYHTVRYVYDLELDENGVIVGGEWYSNFHPDFLWNPTPESRAMSQVEKSRETPLQWDGDGAISDEVHEAAMRASGRGEPLAVVIERLVQLAATVPTETTPANSQPAAPARD
ncbi:MAG: hypothetical protein NDI61_01055 [Bdellovibrionaceae bacterium]|nr:hypothetical protein [Pseudobdellovibrionaceae bacterium]